MKKFFAPQAFIMAILALLVVGRGAGASEAIGWITLLDEEDDQIVLDSGRTFALSDDINFSSLADGRRVRVTYETIGGVPTVTGIVQLPSQTNQADAPSLDGPVPVCAKSMPHSESGYGAGQTTRYC